MNTSTAWGAFVPGPGGPGLQAAQLFDRGQYARVLIQEWLEVVGIVDDVVALGHIANHAGDDGVAALRATNRWNSPVLGGAEQY
jgi:hypothetical protein